MWTEEKIRLLKELYSTTDNKDLEILLSIKSSYIIKKANNLSLYKSKSYLTKLKKRLNTGTFWSEEEINILKEKYITMTNANLSILLKKTKKNINRKLKRLGLFRNGIEKKNLRLEWCKKNGRDLSYEFVKELAKKYNTRYEFYLYDSSAYNKALKCNWLEEISEHMCSVRFSIPQLILKDILEFILNEKCSYNDRNAIKPLEIDCYFKKFKIGWEYNGKYFHNDKDDNKKEDICKSKNIILFSISEKTKDFRKYEKNIKNQIFNQVNDIENLTGIKIDKEKLMEYQPKLNPPNLLSLEEKELINGKKMSDIKKIDNDLFKLIKKYKLFEKSDLNITNDLKKYHHFESFEEYKNYIISKYSSFKELCKYEHPYRTLKKWSIPISELKRILNND
jgi:hypothetical protein